MALLPPPRPPAKVPDFSNPMMFQLTSDGDLVDLDIYDDDYDDDVAVGSDPYHFAGVTKAVTRWVIRLWLCCAAGMRLLLFRSFAALSFPICRVLF